MSALLDGLARAAKRSLRALGVDVRRYRPPHGAELPLPELREELRGLRFAGLALQKLLDVGEFESVLDIGCGAGEHARILAAHGKRVTAIDYGRSIYYAERPADLAVIEGDFQRVEIAETFDAVWASHVLEHQLDPHGFLRRVHEVLREGGWLAITVPPRKDDIVGGHVTLWNAGLLLYRLVLAGFDCRDAAVATYGYNISVVVRKRSINLPELAYDHGDVDRIARYLPAGLAEGFLGDIAALNW